MNKTVKYYIGEDGEVMRVLPSGSVSFSGGLRETLRDMWEYDKAGYEVFIDDKPLMPKTGVIAWLQRKVDRMIAKRKER